MVSKFLPPCISSPSPSCPGVSLSQPTLHPPGLSLTYQASHTLPLHRLFLPPLEHIPSMSSWLSLAQASRFKLKVASSAAPFLCMGEPANTFPHALPCNAFTVTLIMSCGIMLSVSSSRIQALWGRVCIQMNQPWLEVGSPKLPYPQDPEVLSSLSTCLPGWDREAPAWE